MQKTMFFLMLLPAVSFSQDFGNWQHLDPAKDSIPGISTYKAYEYLEGRVSDTVIVAIIDNGVDITHEDLRGKFWENPVETAGNNRDDDGNGLVDDIYGWNYLGNANGTDLKNETLELTRLYAYYENMFRDADTLDIPDTRYDLYLRYQKIKAAYESEVDEKLQEMEMYLRILLEYHNSDSVIRRKLKKEFYSEADVEKIRSRRKVISQARDFLLRFYAYGIDTSVLTGQIGNLTKDLETELNPSLRSREDIIGDDPGNMADTIYGNNHVDAMGPSHGTGVAGIIAAEQNDTGIDGIAKAVKIMVLRAVPDGDERDKDVALAIRYAVRHGAAVINCSFGKQYSAYPEFVSDALEEAEREDVLIVHASGNDGTNTDSIVYYPNGLRSDGSRAGNWISVGASTPFEDEGLVAPFSNYGGATVDVFAPGYQVRSCSLSSSYSFGSGTSFSAPVVAGVAAVLKSYFPHLTAPEIREIILRSSYKPEIQQVMRPGGSGDDMVEFSALSVSGGIVNLYAAVVLADREYGTDPEVPAEAAPVAVETQK